jgi:hypothetical protein
MSEGFHVEAIFGDAVGPDEDLPRAVRDVD